MSSSVRISRVPVTVFSVQPALNWIPYTRADETRSSHFYLIIGFRFCGGSDFSLERQE